MNNETTPDSSGQNNTAGAPAATSTPTLTIAVLTKNEAHRIRNCLQSAAFADQCIVVDSGSTDNTRELAQAAGAEVFNYPDWQGFAVQRNRLLQHSTCDYIFFLDADEVITPELQAELQAVVQSGARAVWRIQWRMVAFGHELKHFRSQSKVERLFRRDMLVEYVGVVHEQAILTEEPTPRHVLKARLLHYSRETVYGSLEKLAQYSMLGAAKRAEKGKRGGVLRGIASGMSMFLRLYIGQLGFLCGGAGFLYCFFVGLEGFFRYAALEYDRDTLRTDIVR
ncbi:SPBc2 prophage-derived glycosyltransferase SunS [compost metagenome]